MATFYVIKVEATGGFPSIHNRWLHSKESDGCTLTHAGHFKEENGNVKQIACRKGDTYRQYARLVEMPADGIEPEEEGETVEVFTATEIDETKLEPFGDWPTVQAYLSAADA